MKRIKVINSKYKIVAMEVSDNDVEVCDGVIYRCTAFIVDMQGELIDNFPGVGCFLTFDDAIDEAMRMYLRDYKKIRVMNVGDKVKISDDIDDSDDIAFMLQYDNKILEIADVAFIDDTLVHYYCKDENGEIIYLRNDVPFGFIDADIQLVAS